MATVQIQDQNFKESVKEGVVLVDFWAPWCGPCKMIGPELDKLSDQLEGKLTVAKLNVDDNPSSAGEFGVMSIPTLKLFKNGEVVATTVGVKSAEQLAAWVEPHLA